MINLLRRASSDTPTIQGKDDSRILRYAVGDQNGVVEKFGSQCSYSSNGVTFKINSGEIIKDGWQAVIDADGASITLNGGNAYYSIYLEYNLTNVTDQKSTLKAVYNTSAYPGIPTGEDLTVNPIGVGTLLLYHVRVTNGVISEVIQKFSLIKLGHALVAQKAVEADTQPQTDKSEKIATTKYVKEAIEEAIEEVINTINNKRKVIWAGDPLSISGNTYLPVVLDTNKKYEIIIMTNAIEYANPIHTHTVRVDFGIQNPACVSTTFPLTQVNVTEHAIVSRSYEISTTKIKMVDYLAVTETAATGVEVRTFSDAVEQYLVKIIEINE